MKDDKVEMSQGFLRFMPLIILGLIVVGMQVAVIIFARYETYWDAYQLVCVLVLLIIPHCLKVG